MAKSINLHSPSTLMVISVFVLCAAVVSIGSVRGEETAGPNPPFTYISAPPDAEMVSAGTLDNPVPFITAPGDLPRFDVTVGSGTTGDGYLFMSPFNFEQVGKSPAYLLILDDNAEPVYYHRFDRLPNAMDFKKQPNGLLTYYDRIQRRSIALNNRYEVVGNYGAGNGYAADLHDLQVLDNGHYLVLIYDQQVIDMSGIYPGGNPEATVVGCIVQELDAAANVVFEWRSWDHIDILDSTQDFTAAHINYMNCNSIESDNDGNLLLSSRNLDEITKINRQTGAIMWRMGGKKNEFVFTNGGEFSRQHDARRLDNGHMTLFDNGVLHTPARSRGLEIEVDEINKTVKVVREFRNTPDAFARAMGSNQRLPNGNSVIGWGRSSQPVYSEFDPLGGEVLEFSGLSDIGSYRVFRFPWQGYPQWPPALVAYADGQDVTLYFSWNGSTETSGYMIFAELNNEGELHVANVPKDGFENSYEFTLLQAGVWKFRIVALGKDFQPKGASNVATLLIGGMSNYLPITAAAVKN